MKTSMNKNLKAKTEKLTDFPNEREYVNKYGVTYSHPIHECYVFDTLEEAERFAKETSNSRLAIVTESRPGPDFICGYWERFIEWVSIGNYRDGEHV